MSKIEKALQECKSFIELSANLELQALCEKALRAKEFRQNLVAWAVISGIFIGINFALKEFDDFIAMRIYERILKEVSDDEQTCNETS
ncbi:MAG: hypothetical protein QW734_01180 [Candidatus Bathyarchaeia archaeon]